MDIIECSFETEASGDYKPIRVGNETELLDRLCPSGEHTRKGYYWKPRPAVFLVGSALSMSDGKIDPSKVVPGTAGIINLIKEELRANSSENDKIDLKDQYQNWWSTLYLLQGPEGARKVLQNAVIQAFKSGKKSLITADEREFEIMESRLTDWHIPSGSRALGAIVAEFPERFGKYLLTTNFDPLLAVSIRLAGGRAVETALHGDGNPKQTLVKGCHLVHLHGYWYRDALHTPIQLNHERKQLSEFLKEIIRNYTVVVMGYGGWDDIFTKAVAEVIAQQNAEPDILWTFYDKIKETTEKENEEEKMAKAKVCELARQLACGVARGRVSFYVGINCHNFLPELLKKLRLKQTSLSESVDIEIETARKILCQGLWMFLSGQGNRFIAAFEENRYPNQEIDGKIYWYDLADLFMENRNQNSNSEKSVYLSRYNRWKMTSFDNGEGTIQLSGNNFVSVEIKIPIGVSGPFYFWQNRNPNENKTNQDSNKKNKGPEEKLKNWFQQWKKKWKPKWDDALKVEESSCRDYWPYYSKNILSAENRKTDNTPEFETMLILPQPQAQEFGLAPDVAIHLKSCHGKEFDEEKAIKGYWIKLARFGGTYVVKLDECGGLTEYRIFDRAIQWHGRWWIESENSNSEKTLNLWLETWCLSLPCIQKEPKDKIKEWLKGVENKEERFKISLFGPCYEKDIYDDDDIDHRKEFFVAHAF